MGLFNRFDIEEYEGTSFLPPSRNWDICPKCGSDDSFCIISHPWEMLEESSEFPGTWYAVAEGTDVEMRCRECGWEWDAPGSAWVNDEEWFLRRGARYSRR